MAQLKTALPAGITETFVPTLRLRPFVDVIWRYDGFVQSHDLERVLPTGTMQIIINLAEDISRTYDPRDPSLVKTLPGSILCGPYSRCFIIDTAEQASVLGVSFAPGGAFPFLGMPAAEARDTQVPLADVWGAGARDLREQLLAAGSPEARFLLLEEWLIERARGQLSQHPAVAYALTEFGGVPHTRSVSEVTDTVGLSPRRFIEVFDEEVGLTPKLFCRIKRFQHAIRLAHQSEDVDWADLAAMSGYYDQSHLIRDFQEFSGLSPSGYLKQQGPHLNHVPLSS